jgi:hypothetical protein
MNLNKEEIFENDGATLKTKFAGLHEIKSLNITVYL